MDEWRDIEAIKQLKARYFRFVDTKQWEAFGGLFTEDAVMLVNRGVTTWGGEKERTRDWRGREQIREAVRNRMQDLLSVHHGHMPEIELTSPTTATGIWAMEDIVENRAEMMRGHGHYHETYRKIGDRWFIASLELNRLRVEITTLTRSPG